MRLIILLFAIVFYTNTLFSQNSDDKLHPRDEPYPAPVMYNNVTQMEAAFIKLFEDREVSNMHVYASGEARPSDDYYFKGNPVFPNLKDFLPRDLHALTYIQNYEPHAVMSMRGEGEELYVIRLPGKKWENQLVLFDMENNRLVEKQVLASYDCNYRSRCVQVDSWLQDVNGDTRLDIIQKRKVTKRNGKEKVKTKVYLMDQQGNFKRNRKVDIQENDYKMKDIFSPEAESQRSSKL